MAESHPKDHKRGIRSKVKIKRKTLWCFIYTASVIICMFLILRNTKISNFFPLVLNHSWIILAIKFQLTLTSRVPISCIIQLLSMLCSAFCLKVGIFSCLVVLRLLLRSLGMEGRGLSVFFVVHSDCQFKNGKTFFIHFNYL